VEGIEKPGCCIVTAAVLLSRLDRVRKTGPDRWVACCPTHDSTSKSSLAIRELPDGRVLIHDFGGCDVETVLGTVGLTIADLFPKQIDTSAEARADRRYRSRVSAPFPAVDVLRAIVDDVLIAATVARGVADVGSATEGEVALLFTIAGRMARAAELANASR
jgi:hypothetical protein